MMKNLSIRIALTVTMVGGLLLAAGSPARADRDYSNDCNRKLEADRARIDNDAHRYGEKSRQVDRDVQRMDGDRAWCRNHKADWDHNKFDIGIYFRK
jgi:hypothetical protein